MKKKPEPLAVGDRVQTHEQNHFGQILAICDRMVQVDFGGQLAWLDRVNLIYAPDAEVIRQMCDRLRSVRISEPALEFGDTRSQYSA